MRQIIAAIGLIVSVVSLTVFAFTSFQVGQEEERLRADIQYRSTLLAENLRQGIEPNFVNRSNQSLQNTVDRSTDTERYAGLIVYDNQERIVASASAFPQSIETLGTVAANTMDGDKAGGELFSHQDRKYYAFAVPLRDGTSVVGALLIVQNANYIDVRLQEIWRNNILRLLLQALLISMGIFLVFRWIIYAPVRSIVSSLKEARLTREDPHLPRSSSLFAPLLSEVSTMQKSLREARMSAQEEARLGLEKAESPWTAQRLQEFIKDSLKGRPVVVVSNREPYIHTKTGKTIAVHVPASGMVTALEPVMTAVEGTWIAWGSGDADREVVDERDAVRVPPDEPKYTLRRVWLTKEEEKKYYDGFCNEGLWPLCHISHTRPTFRKEDWEVYKKVNGLFAQTVLDEIKDTHRPIVLIQDFHLALLPRIIKNARPDATIGLFWHIPWPNPESFSICPWKKELVDGMLGADMIGFHTQLHCNNFVETISRELESLIDYEQFAVARGGHTSHVRSFPISIAFNNGNTGKSDASEEKDDAEFLKSLGVVTPLLGFGVDRLDYTKGILERLKAIEIFFEANPSYVGKFTFVQIAAPSRTKVARYREYGQAVRDEVKRINDAYGKKGWQPIVLIVEHHSHQDLARLYRKTNVCVVTSLHDGMNLVAKEFVAARNDEKGVLVLSQFAGASKELRDALIVNPYNAEQTAEAIKTALTMMESEQKRRMRRMRATVKSHNVYQWSAGLLRKLLDV